MPPSIAPDGLTPEDERAYHEEERLHRNAEALASSDLDSLLAWASAEHDAPRLVDEVITELGIPSPDLHPSGAPAPGSIIRKILRHAQIESLVRSQRRRSSLRLVEA